MKGKNNYFKDKNTCKTCLNVYKKEKIECKVCNTITSRNYYYEHMKKHPKVIPIIGKICSKCKIDKTLDSFHNDKSKKDGKGSNCKDCRKTKSNDKLSNKFKKVIDLNRIECIPCNKIISKTNWSKHEKTIIHKNKL
jgi:hypothetical protein